MLCVREAEGRKRGKTDGIFERGVRCARMDVASRTTLGKRRWEEVLRDVAAPLQQLRGIVTAFAKKSTKEAGKITLMACLNIAVDARTGQKRPR